MNPVSLWICFLFWEIWGCICNLFLRRHTGALPLSRSAMSCPVFYVDSHVYTHWVVSVPSVASNEAYISILVLVFFQVVHWTTLFVWSLAGTFAITVLPSTLFLFKYLGPLLSFVGDGWNWLWLVQWNRNSSRLLVEFVTARSCVIILLFLFSKPLVANPFSPTCRTHAVSWRQGVPACTVFLLHLSASPRCPLGPGSSYSGHSAL